MNNSITIVGFVGQNPTITKFASGKQVVKFSVAVKEYTASDDSQTLWLNIAAWNGLGEKASNLITKGREIVVSGKLAIESYDSKDGQKISKPVIILSSFHLCGKRPAEPEVPVVEIEPEPAKTAYKSKKEAVA